MAFGLRHPTRVHRMIGMSGTYDIRTMTQSYSDGNVYACNPLEFIPNEWEQWRLDALRRQDIIIAIGNGDPHFQQNIEFSGVLWNKGIGNAFREWEGFAHDWPVGTHDRKIRPRPRLVIRLLSPSPSSPSMQKNIIGLSSDVNGPGPRPSSRK
jgi:esterase/lipase superfamily enzyme